MNNRLINTKVAGGGGGCTDIVDNYDPFGGNGVALYQLNGDATDVSGNYNGTASNVTYGTGVFGQAGVFNGSSSKIELQTLTTGLSGSSPRSVSLWVNLSTLPSPAVYTFYSSGTNANGQSFQISVTNTGALSISYYNRNINSVATLSTNTWYHIVATYKGGETSNFSNTEIYINGNSQTLVDGGGTYIGVANIPDTNHSIGYAKLDNLYFTNGKIDQVRIFNEALTPLEVEALYTEELCICDGTVDTLDILGDGSCIATYQLDGNANDLSGNYSGTPTDVSYGVGEFDLAGVFNGGTSSILLSNTIFNTSNILSFSAWVKTTDASDSWIVTNRYGTHTFSLRMNANGSVAAGDWLASANNITTTTTINDGNWHNIVYINNSGTITIYIDKISSATGIHALVSQTVANGNQIGNSDIDNTTTWNGSIDQVRIFNKALSAGEVTTLYNETACTKPACTGTTNTLDILGDGSCIATYPLDGSPADLSGNYNGVQTDVTYPQGYFDLAGSFNGSSSKVESQNFTTLNSFSISFWIKTTNTNIQSAFQFDDGSNVNANLFFIETNTFNIYPYNTSGGAGSLQANIPANFRDGNFHNFIYTTNGTTEKIYVDNVELSTTKLEGYTTTARTTNKFTLGVRRDGFGDFNGQIDQVRIFNKALSASEVTTLYNETPCN